MPGKQLLTWRDETIVAFVARGTWYLIRGQNLLKGPPITPGEEWSEFTPRLLAWLDVKFGNHFLRIV